MLSGEFLKHMCKIVPLLNAGVLIYENHWRHSKHNYFHTNCTIFGFFILKIDFVVSKYRKLHIYKSELNRPKNVFGIWSYMKKYKFLCLHLVFLKEMV